MASRSSTIGLSECHQVYSLLQLVPLILFHLIIECMTFLWRSSFSLLTHRSSTFMLPTAPMSIRIRQTQAITEGDVMREVDSLALTGDWLLVKAGYIGNLNLEQAVTDFTAKRKKDPSLLMECLVASRARR